MTYSINDGTSTEAFGFNNINTVLSELPDNTSKLITPHDLRDSAYTVWQAIGLKPTTNSSNIEYIGIDQTNLYEKIFLGKKQVSSVDVLTVDLLNSDIDHFVYNTKTDSVLSNQNTKMAILAGASPSIFYYGNTLSVPYIGAKVVNNLAGTVLDLNIINDSYNGTNSGGNINILSKYGNVLINGLIFPTYAENIPGAVLDNSVLVYKNVGGNSYLQWQNNSPSTTSITASGTFSINANTLLLNGFDLQFTDDRPTTTEIGSIIVGSTFSAVALIEMIRMLLYSYVPPRVSLVASETNYEVTSFGTIGFTYSITKITASSSITSITTTPILVLGTASPITYLSSTASINRTYSGNATYSSLSYYNSPGVKGFTLSVKDNVIGTVSTNAYVNVVYPIFYGTAFTHSSVQATVQSLLSSFDKIVDSNISRTVPLSGTGVCLYYCVPNMYNVGATISSIYDVSAPLTNVKNNFRANGSAFTMSLSSPTGLWSSVLYNCYIYSPSGTASATSSVTTLGVTPFYSTNYQFNF